MLRTGKTEDGTAGESTEGGSPDIFPLAQVHRSPGEEDVRARGGGCGGLVSFIE